jgi:hypothetical protein
MIKIRKKNLWVVSIVASMLLILTSFPVVNIQSAKITSGKLILDDEEDLRLVELRIYHIKEGGKFTKWVRKIAWSTYKALVRALSESTDLNLTAKKQLEKKLEILKEYNLVPENITLKDIVDVEKLEQGFPLEVVVNENFQAHFAPIFILGIGFGLGLGFERRIANAFVHFLAIVGGLGVILCCDFIEGKLYVLWTYTFPIFIGYMAGYVGLIAFAVFPGYFYSNFIALGLVPYTFWFQIPPVQD